MERWKRWMEREEHLTGSSWTALRRRVGRNLLHWWLGSVGMADPHPWT